MTESTVAMTGAGAALPGRVVTNAGFAHLDTSDEWIVKRTGIRERRFLDPGASLAELATRAAADALLDSGRTAAEVDYVIAATITADRVTPGIAVDVATRLGCRQVAAFDVNAACSGFLYALDLAAAAIESGRARCVLVCGADALSRITDPADRTTAVLLADAAGAVVLTAADAAIPPAFTLGSDGSRIDLLYAGSEDRVLRMRGQDIYQLAIEVMTSATERVLARCGRTVADLDLLIVHQANARIIRAVARRLAAPAEKVFLNIDRVANTSAASIPVALAQASAENALKPGAFVGLTAFGAGLAWGAGVMSWKPLPDNRPQWPPRGVSAMPRLYLGPDATRPIPFEGVNTVSHYIMPNFATMDWHAAPPEQVAANIQSLRDPGGNLNDELMLYIHVPYCKSFCHYCNFNRFHYPKQETDRLESYTDYLIKEITAYLDQPYVQARTFTGIYIGGGSPSTLSTAAVARLSEHLRKTIPNFDSVEKTFTGEPRTLRRPDLLQTLKDFGWNRVTFGIETLDPVIHRKIGRLDKREDLDAVFDGMRSIDYRAYTAVDIMYDLPGQTLEGFQGELAEL
ncbi:MAG: beta-ketoacyl-ACP synthase 3, partial [Nocardiopsaceae bacterium]|nr:beta-ketoacyl-ACP synthase 3 [Nocardiopsaceae bacterium]